MGKLMLARRRRASLLVVACIVVSLPAAAAPTADSAPPVNTSLRIDAATVAGVGVGLSAERGRFALPGTAGVCASADRWVVGRTTKTRTTEMICTVTEGFRFDPARWTASLDARFDATLYTERFRRHKGKWRSVSVSHRPTNITAALSWVGTGEERTGERITPPKIGICYFPCASPGYVSHERERRALVSGTLRFSGLGLTVRFPARHGGSMRWAS